VRRSRTQSSIRNGRYIGITEPGIIAAEAPNAIVNQLAILPDIEKRLEAFVRLAHGVVVFPAGAGTAEEILYLLGVLSHPANAGHPFPLIFTGATTSETYFRALDQFIKSTLGQKFSARYEIIIDDPAAVGRQLRVAIDAVLAYRDKIDDASYFNWSLTIDGRFQQLFPATHAAMAELELSKALAPHELACNLRRVFSGVVAGNVKEAGVTAVEMHGPFELRAEPEIARALDSLLRSFVADDRMRLPGQGYQPCYRVVG